MAMRWRGGTTVRLFCNGTTSYLVQKHEHLLFGTVIVQKEKNPEKPEFIIFVVAIFPNSYKKKTNMKLQNR